MKAEVGKVYFFTNDRAEHFIFRVIRIIESIVGWPEVELEVVLAPPRYTEHITTVSLSWFESRFVLDEAYTLKEVVEKL